MVTVNPNGGRIVSVIVKRKAVRFPTGDLTDATTAVIHRDREVPATAYEGPVTVVLDLQGALFSPSSLRELIVPLGQGLRGGMYGDLKIVVASSDFAAREVIAMWADHFEFPMFIADSSSADDVERAVPVGSLTATEQNTLETARTLGFHTTVGELAETIDLVATAATNRLVGLERKGYLFRVHRGGRQGDVFVDPRAPQHAVVGSREPREPGEALRDAGIAFDPYTREPIELSGKAAERAVEIIERSTGPDE